MLDKKEKYLTVGKVNALAETWQRCRPENIPALFSAYDEAEQWSERLVTFELGKKGIETLWARFGIDPPGFNLVVRLGLEDDYLAAVIPEVPAFTLLLEIDETTKTKPKSKNEPSNCLPMRWNKDGRFSIADSDQNEYTDSKQNAIPAASAYLFVYSWMQLSEVQLAEPFTAVSKVLGKRVSAYRYSTDESRSIYLDLVQMLFLKKTPKAGVPYKDLNQSARLQVHLGNGLAVWEHPFSFRPVVEVGSTLQPLVSTGGTGSGKIRPESSGLPDETGNSYYDYSQPMPPYPGGGGGGN